MEPSNDKRQAQGQMPFTKTSPAFITVETEWGPRVLARFFENKRGDTATVLVPDAFSMRENNVDYKRVEEHYSAHVLTEREGRLVKYTSVWEPDRVETSAALVDCKPNTFIWPLTTRRFAMEGMGNLESVSSNTTFRIPDFRTLGYHLIAGLIAADASKQLPVVPGWGRVDIVGAVFRLGFYYTFVIGPSHWSTGAVHHVTSSPQVNKVPTGTYKQPAKPFRERQIAALINSDRKALLDREIERHLDWQKQDPAFYERFGPVEEWTRNAKLAYSRYIVDPASFEAKYPLFKPDASVPAIGAPNSRPRP